LEKIESVPANVTPVCLNAQKTQDTVFAQSGCGRPERLAAATRTIVDHAYRHGFNPNVAAIQKPIAYYRRWSTEPYSSVLITRSLSGFLLQPPGRPSWGTLSDRIVSIPRWIALLLDPLSSDAVE